MAELELAQAIRALRAELNSAVAEAEGEEIRFRLGPVDLEFEVAISSTAGGKGGVKFYIFTAEASKSASNSSRHVIKLRLEPEASDGTQIYTSDSMKEFPK